MQGKQILEEKLNGVVQEVLEIDLLISGRPLSNSPLERFSYTDMLLHFVSNYLHGMTSINYSMFCRTDGPLYVL